MLSFELQKLLIRKSETYYLQPNELYHNLVFFEINIVLNKSKRIRIGILFF